MVDLRLDEVTKLMSEVRAEQAVRSVGRDVEVDVRGGGRVEVGKCVWFHRVVSRVTLCRLQ
jgi:hypothetical protein